MYSNTTPFEQRRGLMRHVGNNEEVASCSGGARKREEGGELYEGWKVGGCPIRAKETCEQWSLRSAKGV